MKPLSDTLEAMKLSEGSPKEPPLGLTTTAGQSITALNRRQLPLKDAQLMEILSKTLRGSFSIKSNEIVKYGRKLIDGYWHDNEPIGKEIVPDLTINFRPDCSLPMLNAALAISPEEACVRHLNNLMNHKNMGMNDMQVSIKLLDYVEGLREVPEYVVFMVCKDLILNDKRGYVPQVAELREKCALLQSALERQRAKLSTVIQLPSPKPPHPPLTRKEKPQEKWTAEEWDEWVREAEEMVEVARKSNGLLNANGWEEAATKRRAQACLRNQPPTEKPV